MSVFLALFFIPVIIALIARFVFKSTITWKEMGLQMAVASISIAIIYGLASLYTVSERQIINGEVTNKIRDNDSHMESYSCNCRTVCSGSGENRSCHTECDTCWRRRYTVDWYLESTIGHIQLDYDSSLSSSVWETPDPSIYVQSRIGEHCAKYTIQTNYIKAAHRSLFNLENGPEFTRFETLIPNYPKIYSIYKTQPLLNIDAPVDTKQWTQYFKNKIKRLGTDVNPVLILTKQDQMIKEALEHSWLGGSAKDVAIIVGMSDNKVSWVDGFTVGKTEGNHLLITKIRDDLTGKDASDFKGIIDSIDSFVRSDFDLKDMEDFAYLKKDIRPSNTVTTVIFVLMFLVSIGLTIFVHIKDVFNEQWRYR